MQAVHADWSVDPRKRWMVRATRHAGVWHVAAPEPVGDPATLFARLRAAGRVALGVDLPLGIPRAYASAHVEAADFTAFLRGLAARPEFFAVCGDLDEVAPGRPFYPARGVAGMTRAAHAQRLGFASALDLSRLCDRATASRPAGAPLFWTLGANQTGKAAIAAWRDMIVPALNGDAPPALWPFMGDFKALLAEHEIVLAETYPAEVMRHLGLSTRGSKRRQTDRIALAEALLGAMTALGCHPDDAMKTSLLNGFGADAAGEDRFDATIGVLGVINVLEGRRPDGIPDDPGLRRWEGWVLGQTDLPGARP